MTAKKEYTYTYDNYGNILTKNGVTYSYCDGAWKDRLTAVGDTAIFYDDLGNPTSYLGRQMEWEKGRQLKSVVRADGSPVEYTYNANGIRTSKMVSWIPHTYTLDGTKILHEDWGGNSIVPLYDNEDSVCGLVYDTTYYFQKNLQGDVIAITNENGEVVARYRYDAWGVPTITMDVTPMNIATVNPFRYRGYYYDLEIGMYYLQSRYYDPTVGRFVNADKPDLINIGGNNSFAYCYNSPIMFADHSGKIPQAIVVIAGVCAALFVKTFALSIAMYAYSAIGARISNNIDLSAWWNPIGNLMKNRLENSKIITTRIKQYIKKLSKGEYSRKESVYFPPRTTNIKDLDLAMSVGHADNCKITIKKGKKKWLSSKYKYSVTIELSDKYDFEKFDAAEKGRILTWINNGIGYYPMSWGVLKVYKWKIRHTFTYCY